ncbi:MAG: phosphatidylserine decarboxylase [Lachnospiraceae bacterium]|nr:phosphatidylserine decarboxylase [Lachnospiraceae bacterium]
MTELVNKDISEQYYIDRDGNQVPIPVSNNALIEKMFAHTMTRGIMKMVSAPWYANIQRAVMSSFVSTFWITKFVRQNGICLREYKKKKYTSFHDFFKREIKPESRPYTVDENALLSPCDCKASVYRIADDSCFAIKGVPYTVEELLGEAGGKTGNDVCEATETCGDASRDVEEPKSLASLYRDGYLFLLRLSLDDYHHYMYPVSGDKSEDMVIPGKLYTVHPLVHKYCAVYRENARQFCTVTTPAGNCVLVMQVGALGVGKIANDNTDAAVVVQGEEQGHFEFGGSTILVLVPGGSYVPEERLLANTEAGFETIVKMGERIGTL